MKFSLISCRPEHQPKGPNENVECFVAWAVLLLVIVIVHFLTNITLQCQKEWWCSAV